MPRSQTSGRELAILFEALYLANLLIAPVMAFLILLVLYFQNKNHSSPLARSHLSQTFYTSLLGGFLVFLVVGVLFLFGGFDSPYIWMWVVLYFTIIHSTLVLFGALGLAKAMSNQCWRYPIIGAKLPKGC